MNLNEYQNQVLSFVKEKGLETNLQTRMLDLVSEVGELSKEIIKSTNYGKKDFTPSEGFSDELGDIFFSLICVANKTDNDLTDCLLKALRKYQKRFSTKGSIESGK